MKLIFFLFSLALVQGSPAMAQKDEVPSTIKSSFSKAYPTASKVKWEKEAGKYESSFLLNGKEMSVLYGSNGTIEETETMIPANELPAKARSYAKLKGNIKEASKIVTASGVVKYEAEVKGRDLLFDEKGNFIEEKVEHDEEKD